MRAQRWSEVVTHHGEGPGWDPAADRLRIVDLTRGDLLTFDADARPDRLHLGDVLAAWRPRTGGGIVAAVARGFTRVDPEGTVRPGPELWSDPTVRMNDGGCDPGGSFYCGSMAYDARRGAGSVHRLAPDGTTSVVHRGATISNGLVWAPDGSEAHYADTGTGTVFRLHPDPVTGDFGPLEPWVRIDPADGGPDGITRDAEGGIWIALWGGHAVRRYAPDGTLDAVVDVGARQVSACAFGGPGYRELFITTSRQDLAPHEDPDAGAVFRAEPGVRGLPPLPYAG
ncbi:SMP-30/gluconolactonase/LRE family protein [Streptomyces sp. NRRL F-5630]|uniref:SMP-30/gluconolactonase/LRE family protein n=1 Tax=Streptomyces sp. NRRL F-5630 TaxID=1463864 RepID=UPI003EC0CFB6